MRVANTSFYKAFTARILDVRCLPGESQFAGLIRRQASDFCWQWSARDVTQSTFAKDQRRLATEGCRFTNIWGNPLHYPDYDDLDSSLVNSVNKDKINYFRVRGRGLYEMPYYEGVAFPSD